MLYNRSYFVVFSYHSYRRRRITSGIRACIPFGKNANPYDAAMAVCARRPSQKNKKANRQPPRSINGRAILACHLLSLNDHWQPEESFALVQHAVHWWSKTFIITINQRPHPPSPFSTVDYMLAYSSGHWVEYSHCSLRHDVFQAFSEHAPPSPSVERYFRIRIPTGAAA